MDRQRSTDRFPFRDKWFWFALILGFATAWLLSLFLGRFGEWRIELAQWRLLLWLILLYPFLEEWLFRGLVQSWLLKWEYGHFACCGISVANLLTTFLFATAHLYAHAVLWAVLVAIPSLVFGWFRERYNSFIPGVLLHSGYNLAYFGFVGIPASLAFSG